MSSKSHAIVSFDHVSPWDVRANKIFEGSWKQCESKLREMYKEHGSRVCDYEIAFNDFEDGCKADYVQVFETDDIFEGL